MCKIDGKTKLVCLPDPSSSPLPGRHFQCPKFLNRNDIRVASQFESEWRERWTQPRDTCDGKITYEWNGFPKSLELVYWKRNFKRIFQQRKKGSYQSWRMSKSPRIIASRIFGIMSRSQSLRNCSLQKFGSIFTISVRTSDSSVRVKRPPRMSCILSVTKRALRT